MKVKVYNPTDTEIAVHIKGHDYKVGPKDFTEAQVEHAEEWKTKLHNFLVIQPMDGDTEKDIAEVIEKSEVTEEKADEVAEEIKQEVEESEEESKPKATKKVAKKDNK